MQKKTEELETNRDEQRITWRNAQKILRICGVEQQDFAKSIELTPSGLSTNIWHNGTSLISLKRIDILREMVGERNYELALAEIRREEEEQAHRTSKKKGTTRYAAFRKVRSEHTNLLKTLIQGDENCGACGRGTTR